MDKLYKGKDSFTDYEGVLSRLDALEKTVDKLTSIVFELKEQAINEKIWPVVHRLYVQQSTTVDDAEV